MIDFKKPELSDSDWVRDCFLRSRTTDCAYCFGNLIMWSDIYKIEIARIGSFFVSRSMQEDGSFVFCFPRGDGDVQGVISKIEEEYGDVGFFGLNENDKRILEEFRKEKYIITADRDSSDYYYKVSDLSSLSGKKYHQKRNHISFFEKTYNWSYERIDKSNIPECLEMNEKWIEKNADKAMSGTGREETAIATAFENYEQLGFVGGLLRIDGKVCAYTFGEKMNDTTFCTHVEKAFSDVRGAYPMINREFARRELSEYKFVNREEDLGIEGLRKAKLSYYPCCLGSFYVAEKR